MISPSSRKPSDDTFSHELDELLRCYLLSGDDSAREKFRDQIVGRMIPYVKKIAYGLARRSSDPVEDLIQIGNIGLLKAVEKFNPLVGSSFKTYATYFITGEIRHYVRDKSTMIKAPRPMYELYYRINLIVQQLTETLGHTPSDLEIAQELQCPVSKIVQAQEAERRRLPVSLDQFMISELPGNETVYMERLVDEKQLELTENRENKMLVEQVLSSIRPELREVVQMTYYEDLSQTEIADRLGISQMQVSRRLRKALTVLYTKLQGDISCLSK